MIDPKVSQYIENVRQDVIEIYKCNESSVEETRGRIRLLALGTLMNLERCLEQNRR